LDNKIRDAIDSVRAEEGLKRSTKTFLAAKLSAPKRTPVLRIAVAFACLALALLGLGGWKSYVTPVSAISVDVNPSIELGVNPFDRVVSVTGYNEDGTALAADVELKNLHYADALDTLLSDDAMQPYLENNGLVSITVIGSTERKSQEMRARIAACPYAASPNVECRYGNREEVAAAHDAGLSFGKYRAFRELQELDPDVSTEEVRELTMRQIWDRIEELSENAGEPRNGSGYGGQRNGNQGGK
jgi:hypothetical protein